MSFDPICQLLGGTSADRLHLAVLLNTLKRLALEDRWITNEEFHSIVINSARASVSSASPLELTAIAALVVECFLLSKSNADANTFSFRLRDRSLVKADVIHRALACLQEKVGNTISPVLMDFHDQIIRDREFDGTAREGGGNRLPNGTNYMQHRPQPQLPSYHQNQYQSERREAPLELRRESLGSLGAPPYHPTQNQQSSQQQMHGASSSSYTSSAASSNSSNQQLSMVRLLAMVRKQGMDLLFPQFVHDKVLACIYVAIQTHGAQAHRELIDLVINARDTRALKVSHLESVTKTKVRGVLALLKHANVLETCGSEGQPVQLSLNPAITSFTSLRTAHDAYLTVFCSNNGKIPISTANWEEITWALDTRNPLAKSKYFYRIEEINKFIAHLEAYFSTLLSTLTSPDNTTSSSPLSFLPRIANSGSGRYNGASNDFGSTTSASYTGAPSVTSNGSSYDPMDNYPLFSRQQSQSQFPELLATTPPFTPRSGSSGFLSSLSQTGRSQAGGGLKDCLILKSTSGAVRNVGGHYDDEDGGLPNDFFSRPIESDEVLEEGYGRSIRFPMPLYASSSLPLPKQPHPTMQPQPQMATYGREPYTAPLAAYNTFQRTVGPPPIGRPPQPAEGPLYRQTMPQSQCFYPQQPSSDYAAFNSEVQYHQPLARSSYSSAFVVPTESAPAFPSQFLQPSIPFLSNSPLQSIESLEGKESPRGSSRTGSVRSRRLVHPAAGDALPNPELNTSQADSSSASGDEKEGAAGTSPVSGETSSPGSKFSNKMFGLFSLFKKRSSIENSGSMNAQDISSFVSSNNSSSCVSEANNTDYKPPLRSRISCARPEDIAN